MPHDAAYLQRCFLHFAEMCAGKSPLYATLAPKIADDPQVFMLASAVQPKQSPVNLLFAAVHYLLLTEPRHPLADFYRSLGGRRSPEDAFEEFAKFCGRFEKRIVELVAARRVQTNEVGRCGVLLPAFALAREQFGRRPLYLIDVGASAGLNLLFDRYRYEYSNGHVCGAESAPRIGTELKGDIACPLPDVIPKVVGRVGIDTAPVDVSDPDAVRWVESLIWPDQLDRIELFRRAVAVAREARLRVIAGDGLEIVPNLVKQVPRNATPCVFHSYSLYQTRRAYRQAFNDMLADLGRRRELAHVSLEWLGDDPGPQLHLSVCSAGERRTVHLAESGHHGEWLRWLAEPRITEALGG